MRVTSKRERNKNRNKKSGHYRRAFRRLHQVAAEKLNKNGYPSPLKSSRFHDISVDEELWNAFTLDLLESSIPEKYRSFPNNYEKYDDSRKPLNQFGQTLTLFGFSGYLFVDSKAVGAHGVSNEDLQAYQHLWAIIGHGMGVDDQYNVFLQPNLKSLKRHLEEARNEYYLPSLFQLNHDTKVMVEALVDGYAKLIPGLGGRTLLLVLLRDHLKIPVPRMNAILTPRERMFFRTIKSYKWRAKNPAFRELVSKGIVTAMNGAIAAFFGPYFTNREKADRVIYDETLRRG